MNELNFALELELERETLDSDFLPKSIYLNRIRHLESLNKGWKE